MSTTEISTGNAAETASVAAADMKLEVIVLPASDVERAKEFHTKLGW